MNTTTTMATPKVSFDLVFHMLSEKILVFTFTEVNKVFEVERSKLENLNTMNHLKTMTMVSMEAKFASQDTTLDRL